MKESVLSPRSQLIIEAEKKVLQHQIEVELFQQQMREGRFSSFSSTPLRYTEAQQNLQSAKQYLEHLRKSYPMIETIVVEGSEQQVAEYIAQHPGQYKLIKLESKDEK